MGASTKLNTSKLLAQGFRPYRKTGITYAKQIQTDFAVRLDTGDVIYGKRGDYVCVDLRDNSRWIVNQEVFRETYKLNMMDSQAVRSSVMLLRQGFKPYRKHQLTWAKKLGMPLLVRTLEGDVQARAGDYLCVGIKGEQWPQPAERFEALYEQVEHA